MYLIINSTSLYSNVGAFDYSVSPYDKDILEIYTALKVQCDLEEDFDQLEDDEEPIQQDFIIDIIVVLVGMYEKIVASTVTHYLLINLPGQEKLQNIVTKIIAEDIVKIISILCQRVLHFIYSHRMTWKEKLSYCIWVASIIVMIKLSIDQAARYDKIGEVFQEKIFFGNKV
jgi:hypothetical protein